MHAAAIPYFRPSRRDAGVSSRFAVALLASFALHAWLAATGGGGYARVSPSPAYAQIDARLMPAERIVPPAALPDPAAPVSASRPGPDEPRSTIKRRAVEAAHNAAGAAGGRVPSDDGANPRDAAPLPDPTYYPVRQLDVLPSLASALQLDYPERAARANVAGRVRAMVLIDETGSVNEVTVVDADPAGWFEEAVRAAFGAARFSPARRGERPVKSRVLVNVNYNPGDKEGGLR